MRIPQFLMLTLAVAMLGACGGDAPPTESSGEKSAHDHSAGPHGGVMIVTSDHAAHFEVVHDDQASRLELYVLDADMKPQAADAAPVLNVVHEGKSTPITGIGSGDHWVFEHKYLGAHAEGRFRIKVGGRTYLPALEHAHGPGGHAHDEDGDHTHDEDGDHAHDEDGDHAHDHDEGAHGPHDGVVAAFGPSSKDRGATGWIELKLHDDLGDLELWIAKDEGITRPFDLPVGATVKVLFHDKDAREVTLAVRNREKNEDEDGVANLRGDRTNYFIFPGETGADAKWLRGADFQARVTVSFTHDGTAYATKVFELRPHTHGAHDDHDHDDHGHDEHEGHDHDEGHGKDHDDHGGHDHDK
jgi:hypothetical protein